VSEEYIAYIFSVENLAMQETRSKQAAIENRVLGRMFGCKIEEVAITRGWRKIRNKTFLILHCTKQC
jgi:hypothetical protein